MSGAAPRYATPRTPGLATEGDAIRAAAWALGTPLLPWQSYAADIIGERRPDGAYEHQVVVISVPRQSGKTTLLRAVGMQRCMNLGRDVFYTAQTGKDARARWADMVKLLEAGPLKTAIRVRRSAGSEEVVFKRTGAGFHSFAPTAESLHGYTPPTVMLDEAFAHSEAVGDILMGAIGPAQLQVLDRQLLIVSTMGTAESVFFHRWVEKACAGAARVAGLIWGATEDQDPYSLETIATIHPAVGFEVNGKVLTAQEILDQAESHSRAEYERAFTNRATRTASHTVPLEVWRPLARQVPAPADNGDVVLSYDVAFDGAGGAIIATWTHEGRPHSKVVMAAPGSAWLAAEVAALERSWRPLATAAHDGGPTREVTDQLERDGITVTKVAPRDWPTACAAQLARIRSGAMTHDGTETLEASFTGVAAVHTGDGVVFSRRLSIGDCSAAFATTAGAWVLDHRSRAPKPQVRFAS